LKHRSKIGEAGEAAQTGRETKAKSWKEDTINASKAAADSDKLDATKSAPAGDDIN